MKIKENEIILFSGDSITDGNRLHKMDNNHVLGHGYQYIISGKLSFDYAHLMPKFINKGYSGATMGDLYKKWGEDVLAFKPTVLSILAGTNDAYKGSCLNLSIDQTVCKYKSALEDSIKDTIIALPQTKIIVCEPFYLPLDKRDLEMKLTPCFQSEEIFLRPDRNETEETQKYRLAAMEQIRKSAFEISNKYGCVFVPLQQKFENAALKACREYFVWDGTHPTVAGHEIIARAWLTEFEKS